MPATGCLLGSADCTTDHTDPESVLSFFEQILYVFFVDQKRHLKLIKGIQQDFGGGLDVDIFIVESVEITAEPFEDKGESGGDDRISVLGDGRRWHHVGYEK